MENKTKQIDTCIKTFALLRLLLEDKANFNQVIKVISGENISGYSENSLYSVTLNKYLNTLKLFGLNVKKEKGCYHLINPPYKIDLSREELTALELIKHGSSQLSESEQLELNKFLNAIELRLSETSQMLLQAQNSQNNADFSFYYDKITNKIDTCEKFCREDYKVEIIYYNGKKEDKFIANAKELLYRSGSIRLKCLNLQTREPLTISLDQIISIKQLPEKTVSNFTLNKITVFGLRGRLAKNYKLRYWEYSRGFDENGWLIVVNKDEDENELFARLMKYGDLCKVFTPKVLADKLNKEIDAILDIYKH